MIRRSKPTRIITLELEELSRGTTVTPGAQTCQRRPDIVCHASDLHLRQRGHRESRVKCVAWIISDSLELTSSWRWKATEGCVFKADVQNWSGILSEPGSVWNLLPLTMWSPATSCKLNIDSGGVSIHRSIKDGPAAESSCFWRVRSQKCGRYSLPEALY